MACLNADLLCRHAFHVYLSLGGPTYRVLSGVAASLPPLYVPTALAESGRSRITVAYNTRYYFLC